VVGDAGGALGLAFGIVCGVLAARTSGKGCVIDAAIVDIASMLGGLAHWIHNSGQLGVGGPSAFHDSPFYDVYLCADGGHITLGALEPQFYALLLNKLGLADVSASKQYDTEEWPALKARMTALFLSQPRQHWCELLEGTDACFAPVLTLGEAAAHPHNIARGTLTLTSAGALNSAAAPRFAPLPGVPAP
jgi:alpha-methylacyl-CoA racemase